ncbi:MAG TPA: hypothetical protein VNV43_13400 [Candidatus Acidoferrales bacterium]|nr:hypothetical protein [Candidatus Acidoferrales bacterium]
MTSIIKLSSPATRDEVGTARCAVAARIAGGIIRGTSCEIDFNRICMGTSNARVAPLHAARRPYHLFP